MPKTRHLVILGIGTTTLVAAAIALYRRSRRPIVSDEAQAVIAARPAVADALRRNPAMAERTAALQRLLTTLGREGLPPAGSRVNERGWAAWVAARISEPSFVSMLARTQARDAEVRSSETGGNVFAPMPGEPGYEEGEALSARQNARYEIARGLAAQAASAVSGSFAQLWAAIAVLERDYRAKLSCETRANRDRRCRTSTAAPPQIPPGYTINGRSRTGADSPGELRTQTHSTAGVSPARKVAEVNPDPAPRGLWDRLNALKTWLARTGTAWGPWEPPAVWDVG